MTSLAVVHEALFDQCFAQGLFVLTGERGAIDLTGLHGTDLAADHLQDVGDGHTGRDGVRVDDQVRDDAVGGERHVLLGHDQTDDSLLPVPGGELVAQLGYPLVTDPHLDQAASRSRTR